MIASMTATRIPQLLTLLYGVAIVISIFTGGLVPVLIAGAIVVGASYSVFSRGRMTPGAGRNRQRNRNRNRDRG
jgi:hypothetical protein